MKVTGRERQMRNFHLKAYVKLFDIYKRQRTLRRASTSKIWRPIFFKYFINVITSVFEQIPSSLILSNANENR